MKTTITLLALLATACNNPLAKTAATDGAAETPTAGEVDVKDIGEFAELKLAESIALRVPDAVLGKGVPKAGAAYLATPTKSREACVIRQMVRGAQMELNGVAMNLCVWESQRGIARGGKYKIKFATSGASLQADPPPPGGPGGSEDPEIPGAPGGPQGPDETASSPVGASDATSTWPASLSLFLDDSDPKSLKLYTCQDDRPSGRFDISGRSDSGAKGTFKSRSDGEGFTASVSGSFDNGVDDPSRSRMASQMAFDTTATGQVQHLRRSMQLSFSTEDVSTVVAAWESSATAGDFATAQKELLSSLIGPNYGAALVQRTVGDGSAVPQVETSRAYFDASGATVDALAAAGFAEGGPLYVHADSLPKLPPEDFAVVFDASDWDCSGAVDLSLDANDALEECASIYAWDLSMETCEDPTYAAGTGDPSVPDLTGMRDGPPDLPPAP